MKLAYGSTRLYRTAYSGRPDNTDYSENYDNSDISTDYFDVGYYAHLAIGEWDKPMTVVTGAVTGP